MHLLIMSFTASWGTPLKIVTSICILVVLASSVISMITRGMLSQLNPSLLAKTILIPCLFIIFVALFTVRGYVLTSDQLIIKRPLWENTVDLNDIVSAEFDPKAMSNSFRVFGNGGFFSMTGVFWNKKLGFYRIFGTDEKHSVVLKFPNKTIVVTPDKPQNFVATLPN